ncbi:MAG: hypothetical protein J6X25_05955, partial [Bacteroidales bacterium]|nr:hypothetical protein [Bacteroidales bacterium]
YKNALACKDDLVSLAARLKDAPKIARPAPAINLAGTKVKVGEIQFEGVTEKERKHIINKRLLPKDGLYSREDVENLLNLIYGTNAFESVTYRMEGSQEPYTLVFECQKGQVNELALGVHVDTDEYVYLSAHLGLGTRRLSGFRMTTDMKLGGNPSLTVDAALRPMIGIPTFGVAWRNQLLGNIYNDYEFEVSDKRFSTALDAYIEDSRMTYGNLRAGITYEMNPYEHFFSSSGEAWKIWDWQSYWLSLFGRMRIDTFNDGYFPTKGFQFSVNSRLNLDGYSADLNARGLTEEGEVPGYIAATARMSAAFTLFQNFTIQPTLNIGWNSNPSYEMNPKHAVVVGGHIAARHLENQIPFFGFATRYQFCQTYCTAGQLDLRYCFSRKNFVTVRAGLFHQSDRVLDYFINPLAAWAVGAEYARQSVVGPIKFAAQWCDNTGFSVYASLGFDF